MDLQLSEEQEAFVATTRRFLAAECPIATTRALEHDPDGFDRAVWRRGAELGWTSLLVPEAHGGGSLSEHGLLDLVLVAEEVGRVVAPGPLVPVNVVAEAVGRLGSEAQRAAVLPGLLEGTEVAAWCGPRPVEARRRSDGRMELHGTCTPVEAAGAASHLLVTVRTPDGPAQVLVRTDRPGVAVTPLDGLDLVRRHARVDLDGAVVDDGAVLGTGDDLAGDLRHQEDLACALQCAETVGAIDRVFAMTLEYLGDRWSFGRPLSSYQALKHRMADDKVWLEACHAIATAAARAVAVGASDASEVVSAAKVWIGPHATEMVQDCIQLHGGIGVTWEHDLHLYLRRVTVDRASHGTPEEHAERIAARLLEGAA
ncbi:acyl-CoA dehydrogenase family protein [Dermatobacter hominis]|uniref:acyl-CoA dehydrogenase family protein n=1 Tax=Dermatobacter hominis TaxID=2884263 RepID=UPI001D12285A|nr:acyl-CoA dehydrogenase family protein [Dermatobacter hominis]UDY35035.1 acyl-CoA/acyl-ACP dehydrogenase [Dermatobacter hominis]